MPNRVVREDILTSDGVNSLSWTAEVLYRRLMSIVDDYGRYEYRPSIIRSSLFPLKLDKVSEPDIVKWMCECAEAGLVRLYRIDNKEYLEILKFNQTLRIKKSKYPACDTHTSYTCYTDDTHTSAERKRKESESETEKKGIEKGDKSPVLFNLKSKMIGYGFESNLVEDWLKVRKAKKATNSETAFNAFIAEFEKKETPDKNEILRKIVAKSWSGFKWEWLEEKNNNGRMEQNVKKPIEYKKDYSGGFTV